VKWAEPRPIRGQFPRRLQRHHRINRKDFGVNFNAPLETGGVMLGDDVDITIEISATQEK